MFHCASSSLSSAPNSVWFFHDYHLSQLCESSFSLHSSDPECMVWRVCLTCSAKRKQTATLCVRQKTINTLSWLPYYQALCHTMDVCVCIFLLGQLLTLSGKVPWWKRKSRHHECLCVYMDVCSHRDKCLNSRKMSLMFFSNFFWLFLLAAQGV